jgi:hypothetical protein
MAWKLFERPRQSPMNGTLNVSLHRPRLSLSPHAPGSKNLQPSEEPWGIYGGSHAFPNMSAKFSEDNLLQALHLQLRILRYEKRYHSDDA